MHTLYKLKVGNNWVEHIYSKKLYWAPRAYNNHVSTFNIKELKGSINKMDTFK